jgi:hypothetical protein
MTRRELELIAVGGLATAVAIGTYFALTVSLWLVPLIAIGVFFAVAYPLPSKVAHGWFHNNAAFAISWGLLPFVSSYFVNTITLYTLPVGLGSIMAALVAWAEIRLSRAARSARSRDLPLSSFKSLETGLKVLVGSTCLVALGLTLLRIA